MSVTESRPSNYKVLHFHQQFIPIMNADVVSWALQLGRVIIVLVCRHHPLQQLCLRTWMWLCITRNNHFTLTQHSLRKFNETFLKKKNLFNFKLFLEMLLAGKVNGCFVCIFPKETFLMHLNLSKVSSNILRAYLYFQFCTILLLLFLLLTKWNKIEGNSKKTYISYVF